MKLGEPITWIVLFEAAPPAEEYLPAVPYLPTTPFMHLLDPDVVPALQPIWWCLHLPPDYVDCYDNGASKMVAVEELDIPHRVLLLPIRFIRSQMGKLFAPANVALVVSPDNAMEEARQLAEHWTSAFGVVSYANLTQEALDKYWESVAQLVGVRGVRRLAPPLTALEKGAAERLSLIHRARQLEPKDRRPDSRIGRTQAELIKEGLWTNAHIRAIASLELSGCRPEELDSRYSSEVKLSRPSWHLSVGAAGSSSTTRKLAALAENTPPPGVASAAVEDEQRAIEILVAHRAIARGGFGMRVSDVPAETFALLHDFEQAAKVDKGNHRKTRMMLERIGRALGKTLTPEQQYAFRASRTITAFTDFPYGLAILPGNTAPISACVPVAYRPLTPLTRALQFELTPPPPTYIGDGFSVLIAECLEDGDGIRSLSERAWRSEVQRLLEQGAGKVKCRFEVVGCLADLHRLLDETRYDVLVISAHGISSGQMAGVRIGKDDVFDLAHTLPPVVIFSACAVWPRGRGVISIADLALRHRAMTIIGTLVPIRADHNAFVVMRIFLYIVESLHRREPHLTFADAVTRALASNAIIDVLHGSPRMYKWGFSPGPKGQPPPQVEFMNKWANGRLRAGHVYEDTERVLVEIAESHGPKYARYVREVLKNTSYTPESLFYVMIGWPEKIVLRPRVLGEDTVRQAAKGSK